ncbi:unnamed protein product, partial [marine sediment metagenome]
SGKITQDEMLDKGRQPGALQDKAIAKLSRMKGVKPSEVVEEIGPVLRT